MPMYEYRCPECKAEFEQLVSFSKADEVACPRCKHRYAQRNISRVAVRTSGGSNSSGSDSSACGTGFSSGGG